MQTYLFYDIETTGLNKAFDQILHFAAIRTDLNFNEIERYEIKIRLNPDIIPSPYAMLTHHMRLHEIADGISEYAAVKQIHQLINTPGTISLGYNTLSFDDEFLRFSFYRNLLPPYTHQYANQCGRMDIYPMTLMYFLFKPSVLNWPKKEGKISLKLEELNNANQFVTGRAHHAMVDVEATLALAKKLSAEHDMWDYVVGYFNKKSEQDRLQKLGSDDALMVLGKLGTDRFFQSIVLALGDHYHYKNQLLWLRLDDKDFSQLTPETLLTHTYVLQKKSGEPGFLLPLKERFMQHISPERLALATANKQWLYEHADFFKQISEHYRSYKYPVLPETDIDASLYINGFWSAQEEAFCRRFSNATPEEKSRLMETITNPKLYALALRIMGRNFPEKLSAKQREEFSHYLQRINPLDESQCIIDFKGGKRLTPTIALKQIDELRELHKENNEKIILLEELESELKKRYTLLQPS
jgi:exodeoxyribonuclease-1